MSVSVLAALDGIDRGLSRGIVAARTPVANRVLRPVADLGRGGVAWVGAAACVPEARVRTAARTATAVALAYVGSRALAAALDRPRPCRLGERALVQCPDSGGLPSDQTAGAFAAIAVLRRTDPQLAAAIAPLAVLAATARVYAGIHTVGDVLVGAVLGTTVGRVVAAVAP